MGGGIARLTGPGPDVIEEALGCRECAGGIIGPDSCRKCCRGGPA